MSQLSFSYDTSDASGTKAVGSCRPDPVSVDLDVLEQIMSDMRSKPEYKEMFKIVEENSLKMRSMCCRVFRRRLSGPRRAISTLPASGIRNL